MAVAHWWPLSLGRDQAGVPPVYSVYFLVYLTQDEWVSNERYVIKTMEIYRLSDVGSLGERRMEENDYVDCRGDIVKWVDFLHRLVEPSC